VVLRATQYNVRWTVASNAVDYNTNGTAYQPFNAPLTIAVGDSIEFFAVLTPPANFEINFASNPKNVWESPFDPSVNGFTAINPGVANENTANLLVADQSDKTGHTFVFVAALTDGSQQSNPCTFIMS
jgi:hypothetical protein